MLVDVHHHYVPAFLREAFERAGRRPSLAGFPDWTPERALALMDRLGIAQTLLSVSGPGVHLGDDGAALDLARRCNDYCGSLRTASGGRLRGFAAVPLPFVAGAVEEVGRALDRIGLDGVGLFASYGERYLGDPAFDPLMIELDRRAALVFVHPMGHPSSRALDLPAPLWVAEYPIDTTRAVVNLMLTGALERFPRIRFVLAHAGGTIPFLSVRLRAASLIDQRFEHLTPERIDRWIAGFRYDLAQASGAATFAALAKVTAPDHLLFGSDFPYCGERAIDDMVAHLAELPGGRPSLELAGQWLLRDATA